MINEKNNDLIGIKSKLNTKKETVAIQMKTFNYETLIEKNSNSKL